MWKLGNPVSRINILFRKLSNHQYYLQNFAQKKKMFSRRYANFYYFCSQKEIL